MTAKLIARYEAQIVIHQAPGTDEAAAAPVKSLEKHVRAAVIDAGDYLEEEVSVTVTRTDQ